MQPLLPGKIAARLGDPAVGHHHHDISLVNRASRSVEDLQLRSAHSSALLAVPAVLALDDPAPAVRVGRLHVRPEIPLSADLDGVGAAISVHQVPDGVFELPVGQRVQLGQPVAQSACLGAFPLRALDPLLPPTDAAQNSDNGRGQQNPSVCEKPMDHRRHQPEGRCGGEQQADEVLLLLTASTGAPGRAPPGGWPPAHRPLPRAEMSIGYETSGVGIARSVAGVSNRIG